MAFEHIIQPLVDAGMIEYMDRSSRIMDVYDYTTKAMELIGLDDSKWHFCTVYKQESPSSLRVWLPKNIIGGFNDINRYEYVVVKDDPEALYGTRFEERVKILFDGFGIPYEGLNDDYIELDDLCL